MSNIRTLRVGDKLIILDGVHSIRYVDLKYKKIVDTTLQMKHEEEVEEARLDEMIMLRKNSEYRWDKVAYLVDDRIAELQAKRNNLKETPTKQKENNKIVKP